jgi:hypothetical protein
VSEKKAPQSESKVWYPLRATLCAPVVGRFRLLRAGESSFLRDFFTVEKLFEIAFERYITCPCLFGTKRQKFQTRYSGHRLSRLSDFWHIWAIETPLPTIWKESEKRRKVWVLLVHPIMRLKAHFGASSRLLNLYEIYDRLVLVRAIDKSVYSDHTSLGWTISQPIKRDVKSLWVQSQTRLSSLHWRRMWITCW